MGLCCSKIAEENSKLRIEVKDLADDLKSLENKVDQVLNISEISYERISENENFEIRRLKLTKKDISNKIKQIRTWKRKVLKRVLVKNFSKILSLGFFNWKSETQTAGKIVFEAATTVETEDADDLFEQRLCVKSDPFLSLIFLNRVFEEYMFWKFLKDIKEGNKEGMKKDWEKFLIMKYFEKKERINESILIKASTSQKDDFLFCLFTKIVGISENGFSDHLGKLVKVLVNEFNKVKMSEFDVSLNKSYISLVKGEGGTAMLLDLFMILVKVVKSKRIIYEILSVISENGISKEMMISSLMIELLAYYKITAECFYEKLTFSQKTKIMCSDIIEGLSFNFSFKISQEDYGVFYKVFQSSKDCFVLKEDFLGFMNMFSVKYERIIVSKANFFKSFCDVYLKYERASFEVIGNFFEHYSSNFLNFNQFFSAVKYMNKEYDKDFIESIYFKAAQLENLGGLLSRKVAITLLKNNGVGNKELRKFCDISYKVNEFRMDKEKENDFKGSVFFQSASLNCLKTVVSDVLEEVF